jgi:hypothetical protein
MDKPRRVPNTKGSTETFRPILHQRICITNIRSEPA